MGHYGWGGWAPYVSVAERKRRAAKKVKEMCKKKGVVVEPVNIEGRTIAKTYWGKAWCDNLEFYSDLSNRLPRGRTYVRNGSVIDLKISAGSVVALVSGSEIYEVKITIAALTKKKWQAIVKQCSGKIDSLIELLKGQFSKSIMTLIARKEEGLFPHPKEIEMQCSCSDYATVCKHVAAVFYGVGARLDEKPELLFTLRQVDHNELIVADGAVDKLVQRDSEVLAPTFTDNELATLFGVNINTAAHDEDVIAAKKAKKAGKKVVVSSKTKKASKKETVSKKKVLMQAKPKIKIKKRDKVKVLVKARSKEKNGKKRTKLKNNAK